MKVDCQLLSEMPGKGGKKGFGSRIINYIKMETKQAKKKKISVILHIFYWTHKRVVDHNTLC